MIAVATGLASATDLVTIIALAVGVISVIGAAFVVFRSGLSKATIELLKENNAAQDARVVILEAQVAAQNGTIVSLRNQIRALQDVVTGADAIRDLTVLVNSNHKELLAAIQGGR